MTRADTDYDHDIYGDPTEAAKYNGMGWVGMTAEERKLAKADPMTARLIANLEKVIEGWSV